MGGGGGGGGRGCRGGGSGGGGGRGAGGPRVWVMVVVGRGRVDPRRNRDEIIVDAMCDFVKGGARGSGMDGDANVCL